MWVCACFFCESSSLAVGHTHPLVLPLTPSLHLSHIHSLARTHTLTLSHTQAHTPHSLTHTSTHTTLNRSLTLTGAEHPEGARALYSLPTQGGSDSPAPPRTLSLPPTPPPPPPPNPPPLSISHQLRRAICLRISPSIASATEEGTAARAAALPARPRLPCSDLSPATSSRP